MNGWGVKQTPSGAGEVFKRYGVEKPPLGILPKRIWELQRLDDLQAAIDRYKEAYMTIPIEWITEYNELVIKLLEDK